MQSEFQLLLFFMTHPHDHPTTLSDIERYKANVDEAADFVEEHANQTPRLGLILGTGLGPLGEAIDVDTTLPYDEIPHFPESTAPSHEGQFLLGTLEGVPVVGMQGRFHLYEGYSPRQVTFPIRVLGTVGVETLIISNAAGGMNPKFSAGNIMLITDHINFQGVNPLAGPNVEEWGPRFPDMSEPYDPGLRELAAQTALDINLKLQRGVYVSVIGPNLETKAEYRMLRRMGADVVGMSTVPEVIVARHMNIRVMALTVITDECFPDALEPVSVEEIIEISDSTAPHVTRLVRGVVQEMDVGAPVQS